MIKKQQEFENIEFVGLYNSPDFGFSFLFFFLYICPPELKVCIYFSRKRLVFSSNGGNIFFSAVQNKLFSSTLKKNDLSIVPLCLSYTLKIKMLHHDEDGL